MMPQQMTMASRQEFVTQTHQTARTVPLHGVTVSAEHAPHLSAPAQWITLPNNGDNGRDRRNER